MDFFKNDGQGDPNGNHLVFHSSRSRITDNSPSEDIDFRVSDIFTPGVELCPEGGSNRVEILCSSNYDFSVRLNTVPVNVLSTNIELNAMMCMDATGKSWIGMTGSTTVVVPFRRKTLFLSLFMNLMLTLQELLYLDIPLMVSLQFLPPLY